MSIVRNDFVLNPIKSGDRRVLTIKFYNKQGEELDLKDRKVVFSIKRSDNSPDSESDIRKEYTFSDSTNIVRIELESQETKKLKGTYFCDLRVSYPNSNQIFQTLGPSNIDFITTVTKNI